MDLRHVLITDVETTGTGENDTAIEVACIVYSVVHAAPVRSFASLIRSEGNPAERVNHIPPALLADAPEPADVWRHVRILAGKCDAIVAHNADFDRGFVPVEAQAARSWICSMDDLQWPNADPPKEERR